MQGKKLVIHFSAAMTAVYMLSVILVFEMRSIWTSMPKYSRINDLLLMALVGTTVLYILSRKHYTRHFLTGIITTLALCAYLFLYYFYDEYKAESFPKMVLRIILILSSSYFIVNLVLFPPRFFFINSFLKPFISFN